MENNLLGKSSLKISKISFGCMSLGDDHEENSKLLNVALDHGINFFDTADLYQKGTNEISVGKAFKEKRDKVIISTKVGNQWREDGSGWNWNPRKDYILQAVVQSLIRLQTDYIDLYQLHGGTMEDPIDETIEAFEILKQQGKIRYYGISSIRPKVIKEYIKKSNIVSVMMQYSLLDRRPEEECLSLLNENKIGIMARGTLAKGLLINKPASAYLNYTEAEVKSAQEAVHSLANDTRTSTHITLNFVLQNPSITSVVVGVRTLSQLKDTLKIFTANKLKKEEIEYLSKVLQRNIYS